MQAAMFHRYFTQSWVLVFLAAVILASSDCRVSVREPWPTPYLLVPRHSTVTVEINCTAVGNASTPFWAIRLRGASAQARANDGTTFRDRGFFVLPRVETSAMPPILRLLINDTTTNNETVVICSDLQRVDQKTTLYILDITPFPLKVSLEVLNIANISWGQDLPTADVDQSFSLRVSHGSRTQVISPLNESYYLFTAPEGAPPCEVYNFSVTTTYVADNVTYTGAGCGVHSRVLSTMLPSLPIISRLESSLQYVVKKESIGFVLYFSFEPASYCEKHPIMNYTLVVNGVLNEEIMTSVEASSDEHFFVLSNFAENAVYSFRILVANSVGIVSTSDREFYTTDVQVVIATLIEGMNSFTIRCEYITGSNATGCVVVLTSEMRQEAHYNLTRSQNMNYSSLTVPLDYPPSCYVGVQAFDIESDGSIGTLEIPGRFVNRLQAQCTSAILPVKPRSSGTEWESWMIVLVVVISVIAVILLSAVIIVTVGVYNSKKSRKRISDIAIHAPTNISFKTRCPCICQCSANETTQVEQVEVVCSMNESISEEHLPHQLEQDAGESITAAKGGMETACSNMPTNCQPEEPACSANLYNEIASISNLGEHSTLGGGCGKSENVYSEPGCKQPPTKGEKTRVPLEEALYDQPVAGLERTPGDGADYSRTSYCQQTSPVPVKGLSAANSEGAQYATLDQNKDHIYFTLEPGEPPSGVIPSPTSHQIPFVPDTQVSPPPATTSASPPPVYQEITELSTSRGRVANRSITCTANGGSIPNTPLSSSSPPHIQRSLSVPITDPGVTDTSNQWVKTNNINVERGTMV